MPGWMRLLVGLVVAAVIVVGAAFAVLQVTGADAGEACESLLPDAGICPAGEEPLDDPVAAIDAATGQAGITFVRAPELQWQPLCGPTDEVLGRELHLDVSVEPDLAVPDTWRQVRPRTWETAEGATVVIAADGAARVSAPASVEQVEASDRVIEDPEFVCG